MSNMFQLRGKRKSKRPQKVEQKEMPDPGEEGGTRMTKLTDGAIMIIVCNNIATNTTATALRGEDPP